MTGIDRALAPRRRARARRSLRLLAILGIALGLAACQGTAARPNPTETTVSAAAAAEAPCGPPLRIAIVPDKSASADSNLTPEIRIEHLTLVMNRVKACGGELALGKLDSNSRTPFIRFYVPEPGKPPNAPLRQGTARQVARSVRRYQADTAAYNAEEHRRLADAERAAEVFRAEAGPLLSHPRDASHSAVITAISRIGYFLDEPGQWGTPPRRVAIVISDLQNNVSGALRPLPAGTEFYVVNADTLPQELRELRPAPVQLESPEAAIRLVLSQK
ncbi:MAG TPA: hypothetical protein VF092_12335 [Longimicrobium sp.]